MPRFNKFPVCEDLQASIRYYEHSDVLGAVWNLLEKLSSDITTDLICGMMQQNRIREEKIFLNRVIDAQNLLLQAIQKLDPEFITKAQELARKEEEERTNACMHL